MKCQKCGNDLDEHNDGNICRRVLYMLLVFLGVIKEEEDK